MAERSTDPELAFMEVLDEHLREFGPMARAQAARAIDAAVRSTLAGKLDAGAAGRALNWALDRASEAEAVAKDQAARRREAASTVVTGVEDTRSAAPLTNNGSEPEPVSAA